MAHDDPGMGFKIVFAIRQGLVVAQVVDRGVLEAMECLGPFLPVARPFALDAAPLDIA